MYLLDTNVVSVFAPGRQASTDEQAAAEWLKTNGSSCRLSALTIMEIESGIQQLMLSGATRKGPEMQAWLEQLTQSFDGEILAVGSDVASIAGRLDALAWHKGRHPGLADLLIAATAMCHGLILLTRNLRHFLPLGVAAVDPFVKLPE